MGTAGISIEIEKVTPAQARTWLETNEVNRSLRTKVVNGYRRDMEAGRWTFTAEPIQFSRTGRLLNGQHRLTALAGSKVKGGLEFVIARGLPDDTQSMMDQGAMRGIGDALTLRSGGRVKNITLVASISRWMVLCPKVGPNTMPALMRQKVTHAEALAAFDNYPIIVEAGEAATYLRGYIMGSPTAVGYTWLQLMQVDDAACKEFFAGMVDMEWAYRDDPRKAALRRMTALHRDQEVKTSIDTAVMLVSVLTRSWNAWRKGEKLESINVKSRSGIIAPVKPI